MSMINNKLCFMQPARLHEFNVTTQWPRKHSQNSMNKKWKLTFTPVLVFWSSFPASPFSLSLVRRPQSRFVEGAAAPPLSSAAGKKRSQKVGKNLILKNCHSVSIWKFQGYQLPFSDVCFLHSFLRICFAYIVVLLAFSTSTSISVSSSLQWRAFYRVLLLFGKTHRQQANKVKRYWSCDENLERVHSLLMLQRYLLSHVLENELYKDTIIKRNVIIILIDFYW